MAPRSQPFRLQNPLDAEQVEWIDTMLQELYDDVRNGSITLPDNINGTLNVLHGGTGSTSFSGGSVIFSNGTILTQDNANLFWDDTNNRLGIGTAAPTVTLDVNGGVLVRNGGDFVVNSTNSAFGKNGALLTTAVMRIGSGSTASGFESLSASSGSLTGVNYGAVLKADGGNNLAHTALSITPISTADAARTVTTQYGVRVFAPANDLNVAVTNAYGLHVAVPTGATTVNAAAFFGGATGIGVSAPTASLHIQASSAAASSAPIKLTSGTVMTSPEAGAIEFTTDDFFATITTGPARKGFVLDNGSRLTSGRVPFATTNGRLVDDADMTFATDTLTVAKAIISAGTLDVGVAGSAKGTLKLSGNTSGTITVQPLAAAGTYTITLPGAQGASGEVLQNDGSGNLSWVAMSGASVNGVTTTSTGTQNDFAPASITYAEGLVSYLRCNNASLLTITGLANGVDGAFLYIYSIGAGQVDFTHQDAGSSAANRLINSATSGPTSLAAGAGAALFKYDGTSSRWRLVQHYQGDWISVAYNSGDFTATTGTWTVDSGDLLGFRYMLVGRSMTVSVVITNSSVSSATFRLFVAIPSTFTISSTVNTIGYGNQGTATATITQVNSSVSTTDIGILRLDLSNWATSTNGTDESFTIIFPVD